MTSTACQTTLFILNFYIIEKGYKEFINSANSGLQLKGHKWAMPPILRDLKGHILYFAVKMLARCAVNMSV